MILAIKYFFIFTFLFSVLCTRAHASEVEEYLLLRLYNVFKSVETTEPALYEFGMNTLAKEGITTISYSAVDPAIQIRIAKRIIEDRYVQAFKSINPEIESLSNEVESLSAAKSASELNILYPDANKQIIKSIENGVEAALKLSIETSTKGFTQFNLVSYYRKYIFLRNEITQFQRTLDTVIRNRRQIGQPGAPLTAIHEDRIALSNLQQQLREAQSLLLNDTTEFLATHVSEFADIENQFKANMEFLGVIDKTLETSYSIQTILAQPNRMTADSVESYWAALKSIPKLLASNPLTKRLSTASERKFISDFDFRGAYEANNISEIDLRLKLFQTLVLRADRAIQNQILEEKAELSPYLKYYFALNGMLDLTDEVISVDLHLDFLS